MSEILNRVDFFEKLIHNSLSDQDVRDEVDRIIGGYGCDYFLILSYENLIYALKRFSSILRISCEGSNLPSDQIQISTKIKQLRTLEDLKKIIGNWCQIINGNQYQHKHILLLQLYGAFSPNHIGHLAICNIAKEYAAERYKNRYDQINVCICPLRFHPTKTLLEDTYLERFIDLRDTFRSYKDILIIDIEGDCTLPKTKQVRQLEVVNNLSDGYIPQLIFGGDVFLKDLGAAQVGSKYSLLDRGYMDLYISPRTDDNLKLIMDKFIEATNEYGERFYLMPQTKFEKIAPSSTYARKMVETIGYNPISIK